MPGGGEHPDLHPGRRDHVAVAEPFAAEPVRRVQRPHRRPGQLVQPAGAVAVIRVPMGQQDRADRPGGGDGPQVRLVVRAGVDDDA